MSSNPYSAEKVGYTVQCAHLLKCRVLTSENYCKRHLVSLIGFSMLIPDFTGAEKVPQGLGGPSVYSKWYQRLSLDLQGLQVICTVFLEDLTYCAVKLLHFKLSKELTSLENISMKQGSYFLKRVAPMYL
jgi:hypothetical protein